MEKCQDHTGHSARIVNTETNIEKLWKEVNSMKKWVIAGMGGLIVELIIVIITSIYILITKGVSL